jgi:hypothetical protein
MPFGKSGSALNPHHRNLEAQNSMKYLQRNLSPLFLCAAMAVVPPLWSSAQAADAPVSASPAAASPVAIPVGSIDLGGAKMRLRLSADGAVLGLVDSVTGTKLLSPGDSPLAWLISRDGAQGVEEMTNREYPAPQVKREANSVTFTWDKPASPRITGRVWFDTKAEQFHFSTTVTNPTQNRIRSISFPAALAVDDTAGNYLVISNDDEFNSPLKPLDTLKPFGVMYPGFMFMQMAGFKIGNSALLAYTDDDDAQVKWLSFAHDNSKVSLNLAQHIWLKPGQSWNAPYSVVLKPIPGGGYNELAKTYGNWGRKQWWAKSKTVDKVARTPLLKRYFEDGLVRFTAGPPVADTTSYRQTEDTRWHYIENNKYTKYEPYYQNVIDSIGVYEKTYDFKPGYWFPMWGGQQFDYLYPDYFPVQKHMGDFEKFREQIIKHRYPMMYHINTAQWDSMAETSKQKKYLAVTEKGFTYDIPFHWSKIMSVLTSPGVSLPVEMKTVKRVSDTEGVNGIYLDVIGHAFATDDNPLSPFAGQPNDYQLQKKLLFKSVREAVSGPVMTEGRNEIELPYMDMGTGANGTPDTDEIPLWELVYGDCAATTTYASPAKRQRYYTWLMGGVQNTNWDWPTFDGKIIETFVTANQQRVISSVVPELMIRFDRLGESRLSQWQSGLVLWNKAKTGVPVDVNQNTSLGKLAVRQLAPEGIVLWNKKGDFSADGVQEISLNGKVVFRCKSSAPISVNRAGTRWVIHNENQQAIEATLQIPANRTNLAILSGKKIVAGEAIELTPTREGDFATIRVSIPAAEGLLLEQGKK